MNLRLLYIGYVWPETRASAAGVRSWNLIEAFLGAGFRVRFQTHAKESPYRRQLEELGVETACMAANDPAFEDALLEFKPDFMVFDRFVTEEQFSWRVRQICPEATRIVDTQDLHFLRRARERAVKSGMPPGNPIDLHSMASDDMIREIASIYRSDLSLIISQYERDLLTDQFSIPPDLLELTGFFYSPISEETPSFENRSGFVFLGNFRHPPNLDAVEWLKKSIWPRVRTQLPTAQAHIWGAYPSREAMAMSDPDTGFAIQGPAADANMLLERYRVSLAPLRFGAGIKGKIAESWRAGTPVVSTSVGAEGLGYDISVDADKNWGGRVSDDEAAFAQSMILLHQNEGIWKQSQENGIRLFNGLFDKDRGSRQLIDRLISVRKELALNRKRNILGQILWHQSFRSTEYFSRWIEAKNRVAPLLQQPIDI